MKSESLTCDDRLLVKVLKGNDTDEDKNALLDHIEGCVRCQAKLHELAADERDWYRVHSALVSNRSGGPGHDNKESGAGLRPPNWPNRPVAWNETMAKQLLLPPNHPEMLGRLGRYEIERLVGSGGMGIVFKAHDTELNRPVAIKLLAPYLAGNDSARVRFAREARAAAGVVDDHVVPIFNVESKSDPPFLVMQFVAGGSLQEVLDREGALEVVEVLRIGMQIAKGLAAAHAQGLIHRDVKPSNILLDEGIERALLTDFGLARTEDDAGLTATGFHPGTPHYMSPEQIRGEAIDGRSDLFGLGCVLYTLCTGNPPFQAKTSYAVLRRITDDSTRPIQEYNPDVPPWLESIIMKLLSKSRDDRFETADEVAELLAQCLSHWMAAESNPLPQFLVRQKRRESNTMNENGNPISGSKTTALAFWGIGVAAFFVSIAWAANASGSIANMYWDSLGILYGTLIYFSGITAIFVAWRRLRDSRRPAEVAVLIPLALLPAFIGLIGTVHGYVSLNQAISEHEAQLSQADMSSANAIALTSFLVGLCVSMVPSVMISFAILNKRKSSDKETAVQQL